MKTFYSDISRIPGAAFFILIVAGCTAPCAANNVSVDDSGSTPEGVAAVVSGNNQFAFDLYRKFNEKGRTENIFFSPYSITAALAMTGEGARGETADQLHAVLHTPEDANRWRPNFAKIINAINGKDKKYLLSTANALWAQQDYKFLEEFKNTVEKYYGGRITNLDFVNQTEKSRRTINSWVEDQTNKKIRDLIPAGVLDTDTRLVLTNAIYFKGTWVKQFDKKQTRDENFRTGSGDNVKVPMMKLTGEEAKFNYGENDEIQILEMAYEGGDLSMVLVLPMEDKLEEMAGSITPEKWSEWKGLLSERRVDVFIPRFKFETQYFMVEALTEMGMPAAFDPRRADFSGMDGTKSLVIQNVIHKAYVEVNEKGTEAAAATGVIVGIDSAMPRIPVFRADHPFIFAIQQKSTGNILFLGGVNDPGE